MATYLQDLRYALRSLGKRPAFTLGVVAILGLGIGASISVIDAINLLAWRQLPVKNPGQVARIFTSSHRGFVGPHGFTCYPDYVLYRDANRSFTGLSAYEDVELKLTSNQVSEKVLGAAVSGNFFEVLGLGATMGRVLNTDDDQAGAPPAMVLSFHRWQHLGADPDLVGEIVTVEGQAFTVVGIGPKSFTSTSAGNKTDFFLPLTSLPRVLGVGTEYLENRQRAQLYLTGRLQPGVSRASAQANLSVLAAGLDTEHPRLNNAPRQISTTPANIVHPVDLARSRPSLQLFAAAVTLLLIITCANVAHLLLARASARKREMGIRQSLGANRPRLIRQLLTENALLAIGGGICGLVFASLARSFLIAYAGEAFAGEMRFDIRVLAGSLLICLGATLLFGLAPALVTSRFHLVSALKGEAEDGHGRRFSVGQLLSVAQVALCVVLLVGGALLGQSLWHRLSADLGFDDKNLLIANIDMPADRYTPEQCQVLRRQLREEAAGLPMIDQAGTAFLIPPILYDISIPFRLPEDPGTEHKSRVNVVDGGYFGTLGIPLEQGRLFDRQDTNSSTPVVLVNRQMAEQLWPGKSPIGQTIRAVSSRPTDPGPDYSVIGVVGSVGQHRSSPGGEPILYFSSNQRQRRHFKLVLQSTANPELVFAAVRGMLREIDPDLVPSQTRTGATNRRQAFTFEAMQAQAVGLFAVLGFLLAMLGIFGVLSYAVSRRVREVGIRMALGAQPWDVLRQVVGQGMLMTLIGVGVGLMATYFSARLLENLLYGVEPGDLRVLMAVVLAVLLAAFAAAYLPARRASRLDPLQALRHE